MFAVYLTFFLNFILLAVLGLVSASTGAGPAALKPVQDILKPIAEPVKGFAGTAGIVAVIWGVFGVLFFVLFIQLAGSFDSFFSLLTSLLILVVGVLAGYVSVAAFFGAPASGAGKFIDWIKKTFGSVEAIVGLVALVLAVWLLIEFILNRAGVYL